MAGYNSSPLFPNASRRIQRHARQQFRTTAVGKLLTEFERVAKSPRALNMLRSRVAGVARSGLLAQLKRSGVGGFLTEVQAYAKSAGGRGDSALNPLFEALGPFGRVLKSLWKSTQNQSSLNRELDAAIGLLEAFGYKVIPPKGGRRGSKGIVGQYLESMFGELTADKRLGDVFGAKPGAKSVEMEVGGKARRFGVNNPIISGEWIEVANSSNVQAFAYDAGGTGTLKVRFWNKDKDGKRAGPGATYEYFDVPVELFLRMKRASSKGTFIWDHIRVRGTVAGHQKPYRLADIAGGYVPRKATAIGSQEWFQRREFRKAGKLYRSNLPDQFVQDLGGPNRGAPNRGGPNRGTPNRGRP